MLIAHSWGKIAQPDGMAQLDLDTFEDVIEGTGLLISDAEATAALAAMPRNQMRAYSLADVLAWWRERNASMRREPPPAWQVRLGRLRKALEKVPTDVRAFKASLTQRWERIQRDNENERAMKERAEKKARRAKRRKKKLALARGGRGSGSGSSDSDADDADVEDGDESGDGDSDASDGDDGSSSGGDDDNMNAAAAEMRAALLRQEREEARDPNDDGRSPSHTAVTLAIGHMPTMRSALKLDVISALAKKAGRTDPNAVAGKRDAKGDFITKLDVTAGEMLRLDHQERMTRAKANALDGILQPDEEPKPARVVVWADFSVRRYKQKARARRHRDRDRPAAAAQAAEAVLRIVARMFNNVPHDYREAGLPHTRCRCRIATVGVKDPHRRAARVLRRRGRRRDRAHLALERGLPIGKLASVVQKFSLQLEIGIKFEDLVKLTSQFKDCASRLYGPQEDELGEAAHPLPFAAACKQRKAAALATAEKAAEMQWNDLRTHLGALGMSAKGTLKKVRRRLRNCLRRQAESIGYGELSQFGEGVVKAIFERFDADVDDALSFEEVTALQRALGQIPLTDAPEYLRSVAEGGFAVDKQGFITPEGLVAYYDTHGRLAEDAAALGVGAVDDYVTGLLTLTSEIDAAALAHVEALFEKGYHHERALKALPFLARFA